MGKSQLSVAARIQPLHFAPRWTQTAQGGKMSEPRR